MTLCGIVTIDLAIELSLLCIAIQLERWEHLLAFTPSLSESCKEVVICFTLPVAVCFCCVITSWTGSDYNDMLFMCEHRVKLRGYALCVVMPTENGLC